MLAHYCPTWRRRTSNRHCHYHLDCSSTLKGWWVVVKGRGKLAVRCRDRRRIIRTGLLHPYFISWDWLAGSSSVAWNLSTRSALWRQVTASLHNGMDSETPPCCCDSLSSSVSSRSPTSCAGCRSRRTAVRYPDSARRLCRNSAVSSSVPAPFSPSPHRPGVVFSRSPVACIPADDGIAVWFPPPPAISAYQKLSESPSPVKVTKSEKL